jgi:hypothetical protein
MARIDKYVDKRSVVDIALGAPRPRPPRTLDEILDALQCVTNGLIGGTVVTGVRAMENARAPR